MPMNYEYDSINCFTLILYGEPHLNNTLKKPVHEALCQRVSVQYTTTFPGYRMIYMKDCGLFVSMLEDGTQYDILQGNLYGYKGAIYENLIADIFSMMGLKLYYLHKDSGLEMDFVIRYKGKCTLVEVKASTGNAKSTKTVLRHPEKYRVYSAIKLGDYNVGRSEQLLILPLYMAFLLRVL